MFLFNAIIAGIYGALFILLPKELGELNGFIYSIQSDILVRIVGAVLFGFGLLMLVLSEATEPNVLRNISITAIIGNVIGGGIILFGIYVNASFSNNIVFMSNLIPYIVLILGYGYLLVTKAYE
jgi:hypothetical protein